MTSPAPKPTFSEPKPMQVWIAQGIHPTTPGNPMTAHTTEAGAVAAAVELVRLICKDTEGFERIDVTAENWDRVTERLEDYHGAARASVWITPLEVQGA